MTLRDDRLDAARFRYIAKHCIRNDWGSGSVVLAWRAPMGGGGSLAATQEMEREAFVKYIDTRMEAENG